MEVEELRGRVERHIRALALIEPGGAVCCLVSGGADSTCLWHSLRALGYRARALHVDHGLRGAESDADARFCRELMSAEVVQAPPARTEAELREVRYSFATDRLRATGHTASDQVETLILRLAASGVPGRIKALREDGVVRPLLPLWREETEAYCRAEGLPFRRDSSNRATLRGLIRAELVPLLRRLHPAAEQNLLAFAERGERPRLPRATEEALLSLLASPQGSMRVELGSGTQAVREYNRVWLERGPVSLSGSVRWGPWTLESPVAGLHVRGWRAGDRMAGRRKKVQDVFVDAKIPRSEREAWPLVVRGRDVVVVPGVAAAPGFESAVRATRAEA